MSKGLCVLQAALDASADLGRPLNAHAVQRLVHLTERHGGWPGGRMDDLTSLLRELEPIMYVQHGTVWLWEGMPAIAFTRFADGGDGHAEFTYPPLPIGEDKEGSGLLVFMPKGGEDDSEPNDKDERVAAGGRCPELP